MDLIAPPTIDRAMVAMDGGDYVHDGKKTLHDALQAAPHCQGTAECNEHLNLP